MKIKKLMIISLTLLLVFGTGCLTVMAASVISEKMHANEIFTELKSNGCEQIEKVWFEEESVCYQAKCDGDSLGYKDILLIRSVRDQLRYMTSQNARALGDIRSVNQIIINPDGEIMYEVTVDDFYNIPEDFDESIRLREEKATISQKDTMTAVVQAINEKQLPLKVSDCRENILGGYFLKISFVMNESSKITIDEINETVQECLVTIDELNQQGHSVAAFNLDFVPSKNAEPIYFMSADLIYRDFLWWQSPQLGSATWTGSTPELPEK